jgi:hypothetical protein
MGASFSRSFVPGGETADSVSLAFNGAATTEIYT